VSLNEIQQIYSMLQEIDALLTGTMSRIGKIDEVAGKADVSATRAEFAMMRLMFAIRRISGGNPDLNALLSKLMNVVRIIRYTQSLIALGPLTALGPWGVVTWLATTTAIGISGYDLAMEFGG